MWLLSEVTGKDVGLETARAAYLALGAPAPEDTTVDTAVALDADWSPGFDRPSD